MAINEMFRWEYQKETVDLQKKSPTLAQNMTYERKPKKVQIKKNPPGRIQQGNVSKLRRFSRTCKRGAARELRDLKKFVSQKRSSFGLSLRRDHVQTNSDTDELQRSLKAKFTRQKLRGLWKSKVHPEGIVTGPMSNMETGRGTVFAGKLGPPGAKNDKRVSEMEHVVYNFAVSFIFMIHGGLELTTLK